MRMSMYLVMDPHILALTSRVANEGFRRHEGIERHGNPREDAHHQWPLTIPQNI